ncbi:MAG: T9SS type A sorting domain-containing protein [Saprospiraceae bacterium]
MAGGVTDNADDGDGSGAPGEDEASKDEDDEDPALITVSPFDLALIKEVLDPADGMVLPGDTVTYRITVTNQGLVDADTINIVDSIPVGLIFDAGLSGWTYDPVTMLADTTIAPVGSLQPDESVSIDLQLIVAGSLSSGTQLINRAEIGFAHDENGDPLIDIDSEADSTFTNDGGGVAGGTTDNADSGNGTGAPGEDEVTKDEDDEDPALIIVSPFDLALIKEVLDPADGMVLPGDTVTYRITVTNQGLVDADTINIVDSIPVGLIFDAGLSGWTYDPVTMLADTTIAPVGSLQPSESVSIDLQLIVAGSLPSGTQLINRAEIGFAHDENGDPLIDIDSEADSTFTNDGGGVAGGTTDNADSGNGTGAPGEDEVTKDEDDEDPALIIVSPFDLALIKEVLDPADGMVLPGDTVTYRITVTNQGLVDADTINIVDSIPVGLIFDAGLSGWTYDPVTMLADTTIAPVGSLQPNESVSIDLQLIVAGSLPSGTQLINRAEIGFAHDENGDPLIDIDSEADSTFTNDGGGVAGGVTDNADDGDGSGAPGEDEASKDEDDEDPALITVSPFDLALIKEVLDPADGMVLPGDTVTYRITVTNQGLVDADTINIVDSIPVGLIFDAGLSGWTYDPVTMLADTTIAPVGSLQPDESVSIDLQLIVAGSLPSGTQLINRAEIGFAHDENGDPLIDIDSEADSTFTNDGGGVAGGTTDNADSGNGTGAPGEDEVTKDEDDEDPALIIVSPFDLALIKEVLDPVDGMVLPGDTVTYRITVTNQGLVDADTINIVDSIPVGLIFDAGLSGWTYDPVTMLADTTIAPVGSLQPSESVSIDLQLIVAGSLPSGTQLINRAEIGFAHDENGDPLIDIDSEADSTFTNDGGGVAGGATDNADNGNGTGAPGEDEASKDEDDEDPALIIVSPFDLALIKEVLDPIDGMVLPGDTVTYRITVTNQGLVDADTINIVDSIPVGLIFDAGLSGWTYDPVTMLADTTIAPVGSLQPSESVSIDLQLIVAGSLPSGTQLINRAEIGFAHDENGDPLIDIDSEADSTFTNDGGGVAGGVTDNADDGDGSGAPGEDEASKDEDDEDPALIIVSPFDLALIKEVLDPADGMVLPGDTVTYRITVTNQGLVDADTINIVDSIPVGLIFDAGLSGWTYDPVTMLADTTIAPVGSLQPSESVSIDLQLIVAGSLPSGTQLINRAEIGFAHDENGDPLIDIDSEADSTFTNDGGGVAGGATDNADNGNGTGAPGEDEASKDEDDEDPALIIVSPFDLALIKEVLDPADGMVLPGDTVTYRITVTNQGLVDADTINIVDSIPVGLIFDAGLSGWTYDPVTMLADTTIAPVGSLQPDESVSIDLQLIVAGSLPSGTQLINRAEIGFAHDENGDPLIDIDSEADSTFTNDGGGVAGGATDNADNGNGTGAPGEDEASKDEDDEDPALIIVSPFDLALIKEVLDPIDGMVLPGDTVTYRITVTNQGLVDADTINIVDSIPVGLIFDAGLSGWTYDPVTMLADTTIAPVGSLQPNESVSIDLQLIVAGSLPSGTQLINRAEIGFAHDENGDPLIDIDSEADSTFTNDGGGVAGGTTDNADSGNGTGAPGEDEVTKDEDDEDPALITVSPFDLALIKEVLDPADGMVLPGDTVTYRITVTNQGLVDADTINIVDSIPVGLIFDAGLSGWTYDPVTMLADTTIAPVGSLQPNQSVSVDLQLIVAGSLPSGTQLINRAEIGFAHDENGDPLIDIDSEADSTFTNDGGGVAGGTTDNADSGNGTGAPGEDEVTKDEDDEDPALIIVSPFDLALIKEVLDPADGMVLPGDTVTYRITVTNQGLVDADTINIVDSIPVGLIFDAGLSGWTYDPVTMLADTTIAPVGSLQPNESVSIDLQLIVAGSLPSGTQLINRAEIGFAHDENGDELIDIDSEADSTFTNDGGGVAGGTTDNADSGNGTGAPGEDEVTKDEDDEDPALIIVSPFDLALIKEVLDPIDGMVLPGDTVTYRITVTNQGLVDADTINIVDSIPVGLIFDAGLSGWTYDPVTMLADTTIAPVGSLQPSESVSIDLQLIVAGSLPSGTQLINRAEIGFAHDENGDPLIDIDSEADSTFTNDGGGVAGGVTDNADDGDGSGAPGEDEASKDEDDEDPALITVSPFDLALIKEVLDPIDGMVLPGDTVTYRITVTNQGLVDADTINIVDSIPVGLIFDAGLSGWTYDPVTMLADTTIAPVGSLQPDESVSIDLQLIVAGSLPSGTQLINRAEIGFAHDENGDPLIDIDSEADSTFTNDGGGVAGGVTDNADDGDGSGAPGEDEASKDEDDEDPALITVSPFDLALIKEVLDPIDGMVLPGDTVTYRITVTNQGLVDADTINIVDSIPVGLIFDAGLSGWTYDPVTMLADTTIAPVGSLQPSESVSIDLQLIVAGSLPSGTQLINRAEIGFAHDENGDPLIDIDSEADSTFTNDGGGVAGGVTDNADNGNGTGAPGEDEASKDEDDEDPALIIVSPFDLALIKEVLDPADGMVLPGDTVTYRITVTNQGLVDADTINIVDSIPVGLIFDAGLSGWTYDPVTMLADTTIAPAGSLQPSESVSIDLQLIVAGSLPSGTQLINRAEIGFAHDENGDPLIDIDSEADSTFTNDGGGVAGGTTDNADSGNGTGAPGEDEASKDEDDEDPALIIVSPFDLALIKEVLDPADGMVLPGDTVTYRITVTNQGLVDADTINIVDSIPVGLIFDAGLSGWTYDPVTMLADTTIAPAGSLQPSESVSIDLQLIVAGSLSSGTQLINRAEIGFAHDENGDPLIDIDSEADSTFTNDGGGVAGGTTDNADSGNGTGAPGEDEVTKDEDDEDPALITVSPFDLALIKEVLDPADGMVLPGDTVTYRITVTNQGLVDADTINIVDSIPVGLIFDAGLSGWTYDPVTMLADTTIAPAGSLQPSESVSIDLQLIVAGSLPSGTQLINRAEIGFAHDENGDPLIDIDSEADSTFTNDGGGVAGGVTDNADDGDGSGAPGEDEASKDEDDEDPALITVSPFDLALIKEVLDPADGMVLPGDTVTYRITVTNQGLVDADTINIVDSIPVGLIFDAGLSGWTYDPVTMLADTTIAPVGSLQPSESVSIDLQLIVAGSLSSGTQLINRAEIGFAHDENGDPLIDIDSEADSTFTNDGGGVAGGVTDNADDGDGSGAPGEDEASKDEDDEDPALITVSPFDLALIKTVLIPEDAFVDPGDTVTYRITITNQGLVDADTIYIADSIPADLVFDVDLNPDWDLNGAIAETILVPTGSLQPDEQVTVDIKLIVVDPLPANYQIVNRAEIKLAVDENGDELIDIDSSPDDNFSNDAGGNPGGNSDNVTGGDASGAPGDDDPFTDEDDADPAVVTTKTFDLALIKLLADDQPAQVAPGDTIHYTIEIINQGQIAADSILVSDYIPGVMSFINDPVLNPGWVENAGAAQIRLSVTAGTLTAPIEPGDTATVGLYLLLDSPLPANTTITNFAEISEAFNEDGKAQEDVDSAYDTNPGDDTYNDEDNETGGNGNNPGEDDDDHDPAFITTLSYDLALFKELSEGQSAMVEPGDTVSFDIVVINQGQIAADSIEISDYVPAGMTFIDDAILNPGWDEIITDEIRFTFTSTDGTLPPGGLLPGQRDTVTIMLRIDDPLEAGVNLTNLAEIGRALDDTFDPQEDVDSTPDFDDTNDDFLQDNDVDGDGRNGGDEDDSDLATVTIEVFDLALAKVLSEGQTASVEPGDTVSFDIIIFNQGMIAADNIEVSDYVPMGLNFDADLNPDWADNNGLIQTTLTVAAGELPLGGLQPGQKDTVSILLVVSAPYPAGASIINVAEIASATDENGDDQVDVDSTPDEANDDTFLQDNDIDGNGRNGGDEDDHDQEELFIEVFDLALIKELSPGQSASVEPGDTVYFTIEVINQGMIAADNIEVTDYIGDGFIFDQDLNLDWSLNADGEAQTILTIADGDLDAGGLQPSTSTTVEIALIVEAPFMAGSTLSNVAEISGATDEFGDPQEDHDSTPDEDDDDVFNNDNDVSGNGNEGEDEDDHDIATVTVEIFDLALRKTIEDINVAPGDTVTFLIEVFNQGMITADNIELIDYIPEGLLFDEDLNPGWDNNEEGIAQITLTAGDGLPLGGLLPGDTASIAITLLVDVPLPANTTIVNFAEINGATDENGAPQDDVDSTPNDDPDDDNYFTDDDIDADGNNGGDEDDHDGAEIRVLAFDLALRKTLSEGQSATVEAGDTIYYTLEIFNQGMIAADHIEVTDYIPNGLNFDADLNPDWALNDDGEAQTMLSVEGNDLPAGGLLEGGSIRIEIILIVSDPLPTNTIELTNTAEISGATDEDGIVQDDIDSHFDEIDDDLFVGNDDISGDGIGGGDEDDHDPETVTVDVFDLALIKFLSPGQLGIVQPGQNIRFTFQVTNQGSIAADQIVVSDYLPAGLLFNPSLNPNWALNEEGIPQTSISVAENELPVGGLQPGASTLVTIFLTVAPTVEEGSVITNVGEISAATGENGEVHVDVDSNPDTENDDHFVQDDDINGNGNAGGDEDDHDIVVIQVDCYRSAGFPNLVQVCLGCSEAEVSIDLFGSLKGRPDEGGYWRDESDTGLDISDPSFVVITGELAPGSYFFTYVLPGQNGCPDKQATIEVEIVSIENLYCNGATNVSLGESCEARVSPANILQDNIPCYSALEVHIIDQNGQDLGDIVTGEYLGETLFVQLVDPQCDNTCWGTLVVEDKKKPEITCPAPTDQACVAEELQQLSGSLGTTNSLNLSSLSCFSNLALSAGNYFYQTYSFTVSADDIYTFDLKASWSTGLSAIYRSQFYSSVPCDNALNISKTAKLAIGGFVNPSEPVSRLSMPLKAGETYVLVTTSNYPGQTGSYGYDIYSEGNGLVNGLAVSTATLKRDLICDDLSDLLNQASSTAYLGMATAVDNCTETINQITFSDVLLPNADDCGKRTILRTFTAADDFANKDACVQEIGVRKPTLLDVYLPPFTSILSCDEEVATTANGNPAPSVTGAPFIFAAEGVRYLGSQPYCNVGATFSDGAHIEICENSYKFIRTWTILDWCEDEHITHLQIIKVGDFTPPTISCVEEGHNWNGQPNMHVFSTGPFDCTAAFEIPLPVVTDNCSGASILSEIIDGNTGLVLASVPDGASRFVGQIPAGCHLFRYTATDGCGNVTTLECPFMVLDEIEPIAICNDDLRISLNGDGYAEIKAADVDEGSADNCTEVKLEVRRQINRNPDSCVEITPYFTAWGDLVSFACCDAGDTVRIELQVWDDANGNGIAGDTIAVTLCNGQVVQVADNNNRCWLDVEIEDKLAPQCNAPENITISCAELPYDFGENQFDLLEDLFGVPTDVDNCPNSIWEELEPVFNLSDCMSGTIVRTFRAIDAVGNPSAVTCQQLITVTSDNSYAIKFPKDAAEMCGVPHPDTIAYTEGACDLLAISVEDEFFSASDDECYKILRTFSVINWCEYDGESEPIIVGRDEDCDGQPGDEDIWVIVKGNMTYYDRNNNEADNTPTAYTKSSSCDGLTNPAGHWINSTIDEDANYDPITEQADNAQTNDDIRNIDSRGYWQYTQIIKVYDNTPPVIEVEPFEAFDALDNENCTGLVTLHFSVTDACTEEEGLRAVLLDKFIEDLDQDGNITQAEFVQDEEITNLISGTPSRYTYTVSLSEGRHALLIKAGDGCGNATADLVIFEVVDTKAPSPVCINGLAVELVPVENEADADGDGDPDRGAATIWASDFIASPVDDCNGPVTYSMNRSGEEVDPAQSGLIVTCDDPTVVLVEIYSWDARGNGDYCETYIIVEDNNDLCVPDPEGSLAGVIATEDLVPVEDVQVTLSGQTSLDLLTEGDGLYAFEPLQTGYDYTITPTQDLNASNGVTTFDIILITKHILGELRLDSPYKLIAADVNNSRSISTLDIILARRLILAMDDRFQNNTSWRFVERAYVFPDPTNPWVEAFPEIININNLAGGMDDQDFVAVKIGDVNNTASPNYLSVDERSTSGTFLLAADDLSMKAGNVYQVSFTAPALANIQGYQLTLQIDPTIAECKDLGYGLMAESNFGVRYLKEGMLTMSWNTPSGSNLKGDEQLFTLSLYARTDARLSDVLQVSSRYTLAEAYNQDNETMEVALQFSSGVLNTQRFEVYQNMPNPFNRETVIGFYLPEASEATIAIHDVSGKALRLIRGDYAKGYNKIVLKRSDLATYGTLFYTVTAGNHTATRKMIIIE